MLHLLFIFVAFIKLIVEFTALQERHKKVVKICSTVIHLLERKVLKVECIIRLM